MTAESVREIRGTSRMSGSDGKMTGRHGAGVMDTDWVVVDQALLGV
jgi:hypothetical protein